MKQYHEHLQTILQQGTWKDPAREGMPRSLSLFGYQNRYDLQKGFPIVTTKKVNFSNIVVELLWFLKGDTNIKYLVDNGCNIWNEDAYNYYIKLMKQKYPDNPHLIHTFERFLTYAVNDISCYQLENYKWGDCGKQYGWLWRNWFNAVGADTESIIPDYAKAYMIKNKPIDQLQEVIKSLKSNPEGRRHIITAWNPATLDDMALNACHSFVQFNCRKLSFEEKVKFYSKNISPKQEPTVKELDTLVPQYYLDCQMYQRSADMFLGVPYNISSYALLTHIIAKICNMEVGHFVHTFGDSHIYENHMDQVKEILSRDSEKYKLPTLKLDLDSDYIDNINKDIRWLSFLRTEDFTLEGYESYPAIKAPLSTGLK